MDYSSTLNYLQNLLGNKQSMQGSEFGQNLGLEQQELAQQGSEFNTTASNQMQQFQQQLQNTAAQQAAQNALANRAQTSADVQGNRAYLNSVTQQPPDTFVQNLLNKMRKPNTNISPVLGAFGQPNTGGIGLLQ